MLRLDVRIETRLAKRENTSARSPAARRGFPDNELGVLTTRKTFSKVRRLWITRAVWRKY